MSLAVLESMSNWNPQLFRELKGRLTLRNVILAIAIAAVLQLLILTYFGSLLPADLGTPDLLRCDDSDRFCRVNEFGQIVVLWEEWWRGIFQALNWILLLAATLPGPYLLISDIYQEEKRGTLNFIRLSPQTSGSILLGKLLGVPVLAYVAILLILPLHLIAALSSGVPFIFVVSLYGVMGAGCMLLYNLALLGGFLGRSHAKGSDQVEGVAGLFLVLAALITFIPTYLKWNIHTSWQLFSEYLSIYTDLNGELTWFNLPLQGALDEVHVYTATVIAHLFTLGNMAIATYWIWQALHRQFHRPTATLINKRQSYGVMVYLQVFALGFLWNSMSSSKGGADSDSFYLWSFYSLTILVGLTLLLSNQRPVLMDWARFHHLAQGRAESHRGTAHSRRSPWSDLLGSEQSPPILALGIHLAIVGITAVIWILSWPTSEKGQALVTVLLMLNMVALYGAIAQFIMLMKVSNRMAWAGSALLCVMVLPLVLGAIAESSDEYDAIASILFLWSPLPMITLETAPVGAMLVGGVCLAQWSAIALLNLRFIHQLKHLGESASKRLLTETAR